MPAARCGRQNSGMRLSNHFLRRQRDDVWGMFSIVSGLEAVWFYKSGAFPRRGD